VESVDKCCMQIPKPVSRQTDPPYGVIRDDRLEAFVKILKQVPLD